MTMSSAPDIVVVGQGRLANRADPRHLCLSVEMARRYAKPRFRLVPLGDLLREDIAYGSSSRLDLEPPGYPVLRMNNLTMDGWDTSEVKYLDCSAATAAPLLLQHGDILVNRTNGSMTLVGKAATFDLDGDWLYASYLLRLRVDTERILPEFLTHFLNSPAGRLQIERLARRILMINISPPELKSILVPLPPIAAQRTLLEPLHRAWLAKSAKLDEARTQLLAVNHVLGDAIGAKSISTPTVLTYSATTKTALRIDRLGVQFFHPERAEALDALLGATGAAVKLLDRLVDFISDRVEPGEDDVVLGLADIEPDTGEACTPVSGAASAKRYAAGDILYARLRPYLNKVIRATSGGYCSTEFTVLRAHDDINADYLAVALRSPYVTAQTRHLSTGNTLPRVADADIQGVFVPVPEPQAQRQIVAAYTRHRRDAQRLRTAADADWAKALSRFGNALLR